MSTSILYVITNSQASFEGSMAECLGYAAKHPTFTLIRKKRNKKYKLFAAL
jgi:hypothetical protein